mmetsp:Transcript_2054/g.4301  ORF Transcript_2054/g.4301 Transcript_2054/m.4301 type:complete len:598 (+) Transcript_2054:26-1819(+)
MASTSRRSSMASSDEGSRPSSNHPSISTQKSVQVKGSLNRSFVSSVVASDVTSLLFRKTSNTDSPTKPAPTEQTTLPQKKLEDVILSQSLALTDHIFGLYAFELWHYREATGTLVIVPLNYSADEESGKVHDGLYVKRIPQEVDPNNDYSSKEAITAFAQLTDRSRSDYIHPIPTGPGVGLPGVLWSETSNGANTGGSAMNLDRSQRSARSLVSQTNQRGGNNMSLVAAFTKGTSDSVAWRHVDTLANDPDQPFDERLQCFAQAGFTLAAGVPFDINGYRGIAIFFGNPHAEVTKLNDNANTRFIKQAAHFIGAAAALKEPLEGAKAFQEKVQYENWHRMKIKLLTIVRFGGSLRNSSNGDSFQIQGRQKIIRRKSSFEHALIMKENIKQFTQEAKDDTKLKLARWWVKVHGGNASIPPSFTLRQAMWTFFGVGVTHFLLSSLNFFISVESRGDMDLVLPPLGALTTLQYALTAAPASQPRNAIFAQVFGLTIAMLVGSIPNLEPWLKSALAPAIVIPGMAKLGMIHPPAGAACIVFSSGNKTWKHMGIFLAGVCISIITSVVINNMCDKRQYPTSWPLLKRLRSILISEKEKVRTS